MRTVPGDSMDHLFSIYSVTPIYLGNVSFRLLISTTQYITTSVSIYGLTARWWSTKVTLKNSRLLFHDTAAAGLADSQQYNYEWPDDVCSPEGPKHCTVKYMLALRHILVTNISISKNHFISIFLQTIRGFASCSLVFFFSQPHWILFGTAVLILNIY